MRHTTTIGRGIAAAGVAALLSLGLATSALADPPEGEAANHPENWETFLEEEGYVDVECMKISDGFEGGAWESDDDYVIVVLKAGSDSSSEGDPNTLHWDVEEGEVIGTDDGKDISHVIACTGEQPTSTPTPTPSDSETPTPSVTPPGGPLVETDVPSSGPASRPSSSVAPPSSLVSVSPSAPCVARVSTDRTSLVTIREHG